MSYTWTLICSRDANRNQIKIIHIEFQSEIDDFNLSELNL